VTASSAEQQLGARIQTHASTQARKQASPLAFLRMSSSSTQSAEQQRVKLINDQAAAINADIKSDPDLKGAVLKLVEWWDPERESGSCFGNLCDDARLQFCWQKKDLHRNPIPDSATPWTDVHMLSNQNNWDDPRAIIDTEHCRFVKADPDGTNKTLVTGKHMIDNFRSVFRDEGLDAECDLTKTTKIAMGAPRFAFIQEPPNFDEWLLKTRVVLFSYNTTNEADPKELIIVSDPMNSSIHLQKPGYMGAQPLPTKILNEDGEWETYSHQVTPTERKIEDIGTETKEESRAAAAKGLGTQVDAGPVTWKGQSCALFVWQIPVEPNPPVAARGLSRGLGSSVPVGQPLSAAQAADWGDDDEPVHYRSAHAPGSESGGEADEPRYRGLDGGGIRVPRRGTATEGRLSIGAYEGKAGPLHKTKLVARSETSICTPIFFTTVKPGSILDTESIKQALRHSVKCHEQTLQVGKAIHSRHDNEASVEAGLTTKMTKQAKTEIECNTGVTIFEKTHKTPVLTGVPV
tara:strand:+ start:12944 stop:14500 length:1557 start_codon:yes stop_codon:yes gene_type:complete